VTAPLVIEKGRFRLIQSGDSVRVDCDGSGGMIVILSDEERIKLSKALWYSAKRKGDA
jgi:hypothetical protein